MPVAKHLCQVLLLSTLLGTPACASLAQGATTSATTSATSHLNLAGDWQVSFIGPGDPTRLVFRISKAPAGWRAVVYWVDTKHYPVSIPAVDFGGDAVSFSASARDLTGAFTGSMAADHATIAGKWTQAGDVKNGFASQPVIMVRAVKGTAWEVPPPLGADAKIIDATLDPTFEVTTVKPHDPKVMGGGWRWIGARRFEATMPVGALLADIYGLQRDQILGAPDWVFKDVYDYTGVPDLPGWPTLDQRYSMERKMLQDRFKLKAHTETREMSAMLLSVSKGGVKMAPSVLVDPGVTFGMHPGSGGFVFNARNSSMGDFKRMLQSVLDRPVVDKTGLTGQFDFDLTFLPDDTVFGGQVHLPQADTAAAAPDLYAAMQQQLGLKLSPFKGMVEVLVIDHIEKPSDN